MRFIPVKFNMAYVAVRQFDMGEALEFPPTSAPVHFLQIRKVTNFGSDSDGFNSLDFVNDLKFHAWSLALIR